MNYLFNIILYNKLNKIDVVFFLNCCRDSLQFSEDINICPNFIRILKSEGNYVKPIFPLHKPFQDLNISLYFRV